MKALLLLVALFFYVGVHAQTIRTIAGNGGVGASAGEGNGTPAINSPLNTPYGVAVDRKGNVYVADQLFNVVRKIRPDGIIAPYAGTGSIGYSGNGGPAILAKLNTPAGLLVDANGNLYIADAGNLVIRKVDTFGVITLFAGNNAVGSNGDGGPATAAGIGPCAGMALDAAGNMYLANGNDRVRKINTSGIISTVAGGLVGYSGDGFQATAAAMEGVIDVAVDAAGNLYISEQANNVIRKVTPAGIISTFAGRGPTLGGVTGDGGLATAAKLSAPGGIKFDAAGNLYIADVGNHKIRKITTTGVISTYAGSTGSLSGFAGDGSLISGGTVRFLNPSTLCFDVLGHMFIADKGPGNTTPGNGRRIREIYKVDTFHIAASPSNNICAADTVNFTATIPGFYYNFKYNWKVNGVAAGTNSRTFHPATINNNDRVTCALTDTLPGGAILTLAVSDTIVMAIHPMLTPSVTITSTADTVCAGRVVTLTATAVNGGTTPLYQWRIAGVNVSAASSYTYTPANGDTVRCVLTSSETCVTVDTARSFKVLRVNPLPNAGTLSGSSSMCAGTTMSLAASGTTGGVWSASNNTASVSSSGVVTANIAGVDTISYRVFTATCGSDTAKRIITINPLPVAGTIVGANNVCPGYMVTLTDAAPGGVWSISNANATITSGGVVTGVNSGLDTVKYAVTNTCGTADTTFLITVGVSSLHDAGTIVGPTSACAGSTITLSDTATSGFWLSLHTAIATVSASGVVSANTAGIDTIMYIVTSGCNPDTAFHVVTVIPVLHVGTITGAVGACAGATISLANSLAGGIWSSSDNSVATVDTAGRVHTVMLGVDTISYIAGNACGADTATHIVTVSPVPFADTITGVSLLCLSSSATLTDTASGGVWSSSAPSIVSVSSSGFVTSLASGSATISYSVTNSCGTDLATHPIVVNPFPALTSTTTPPSMCTGTVFNYTPTSTTAGAIFAWNRPAVSGILNPTATSTGDPNEILINNTDLPINVIYIYAVSAGGCSTVQNVTVSVKPIPKLAGNDTVTTCAGRTFYYTPASATPTTTYAWTRASVAGVTPATASGTGSISEVLATSSSASVGVVYTFTLTAGGCANPQNLTVIIEPLGPPPPPITTRSPTWLCRNTMYQNFGTSSVPDSTVTYEWTASNAVVWAQGAEHQYSLVNFTSPGLAIIYLSASNVGYNCRSKDSVAVFVDNFNEDVTMSYFDGVFVAQEGMSTYQWGYDDAVTLDSTILSGETSSTYANGSPDFAGKYYWVMTEHYSCKQKTYYQAPTAVANVNAAGLTQVAVSPNPNTGVFSLSIVSDFNEEGTITVTNMVGAKVWQQPCTTNRKIELSLDQPSGIYFVTVNTAHGKFVTKVMVARQ